MLTTLYAHQKWIEYISHPSYSVNLERIQSINAINGHEIQDYVYSTLYVLQQHLPELTAFEYALIERTLQWSEVAKCGSKEDRQIWKTKYGCNLSIHNEASAKIYYYEVTAKQGEDYWDFNNLVETLIKTHGLIGQAIKGEVNVADSRSLAKLTTYMSVESARKVLMILNKCIISGIGMTLWESTRDQVANIVDKILYESPFEYNIEYRIKKLLPQVEITDEIKDIMSLFTKMELWYMPPAFHDIPADTTVEILKAIYDVLKDTEASLKHIMFQPLLNTLYYDYKGYKLINIYKLRIIQHCLKNNLQTEHCKLVCTTNSKSYPTVMTVNFEFSDACKALLDFCVTAENSGTLTYQKSITLIYDMFGFRLDQFDRLNNEDKYLETMNNTESSTKDSIMDYVVGTDIVDVGSGGGVLLDKLEKRFPNALIVGTDISKSVIDKLHEKAKSEKHRWVVKRHNFVDGPLPVQADDIIFSSILHEIFSYTEFEGRKFNINSVCLALQHAADSLKPNGRIIIRDGIMTDSDENLTVTFKTKEGYLFFLNYVNDFQGPLPHNYTKTVHKENGEDVYSVTGNINFMREFLYTYTWGQESYPHEVQEQFGYLTLKDLTNYLEVLGFKIIEAKEFLEEGYPNHLNNLVTLDKDYPNSNCIVVAEKMETLT